MPNPDISGLDIAAVLSPALGAQVNCELAMLKAGAWLMECAAGDAMAAGACATATTPAQAAATSTAVPGTCRRMYPPSMSRCGRRAGYRRAGRSRYAGQAVLRGPAAAGDQHD